MGFCIYFWDIIFLILDQKLHKKTSIYLRIRKYMDRQSIIYQIYVKSFNKGTLNGVTEKLDYLKTLNVDFIWLTPIYKSGGVDDGYDVVDHCEIDPIYGTLDDFKNLVEEAHKRNIKVILDLIITCTSDKHRWFIDSCNSKRGREDWYIWSKCQPCSDNFKNVYKRDSVWHYNKLRKSYYYHHLYYQQPHLNLKNHNVVARIFYIID